MTAAEYWKIRALSLAVQLERERAETAVTAAQRRLDAAMVAAGLDLSIAYRFNDPTEQIVPVEPSPVA